MSGLEEVEDRTASELPMPGEPETGLRDEAWEHCVRHQMSSGKMGGRAHPPRGAPSPQKPDHRGDPLPGAE